ncbi:MAG: hypothetical protein AAF438_02085 [Pseudomonadota bacterium]
MKTLLAFLALTLSLPASPSGFDQKTFQRWVDMRVGTGEPVYWYSTGTIRTYPGGELIATMEGYDTARLDKDISTDTKAVQLSRKTYVYRDPSSGELIKQEDGSPVAAIAYPYQLITYELKGNGLETWVEQGKGKRKQTIGPGTDLVAHHLEGGLLFSAPLFLDFELPGGNRYQTFEHYDFFSPNSDNLDDSYITFVRYGSAPRWSKADKIVMHLITQRFDDYQKVPQSMRDWIGSEGQLWKEPPKDMQEILDLQAE